MDVLNNISRLKQKIQFDPFSILESIPKFSKKEISDIFIFRFDGFDTEFIAENSLALLTGSKILCDHLLLFFDEQGHFLKSERLPTDLYHKKISIKTLLDIEKVKLGSFVHFVRYSDEILKEYSSILKETTFQHRGYTGFKLNDSLAYSYVHGNYGGIYKKHQNNIFSVSRIRQKFVYTPQVKLKPGFKYEFFFVSPNKKNIILDFYKVKNNKKDHIKTFKLKFLEICSLVLSFDDNSEVYNVSWESHLPVGRCIIFENNMHTNNVFHS